MSRRLILTLDSGTSVVKAVAFDETGEVVATASRPNLFASRPGGVAEQDMHRTWDVAAAVLADLAARLPMTEIAALSVTGQGDGTWLVGRDDAPVAPAWLWLDARAGELVRELRDNGPARAAFAYTGTGLAACQQSAQMLWMRRHAPELLERADAAMHCKDRIYLNLPACVRPRPARRRSPSAAIARATIATRCCTRSDSTRSAACCRRC